jgi:hypothetical protein
MTRLSCLQYALLKALFQNGTDNFWSFDEAKQWNQGTFRSMLIRQYCVYKPTRGFHVTKTGIDAMVEFETEDALRSEAMRNMPLTSYFDAVAYGLDTKKRHPRTVREMRKGAA